MSNSKQTKEKTRDLASTIKGDDGGTIENDVVYFQSGDILELPVTDDAKGMAGGEGPQVTKGNQKPDKDLKPKEPGQLPGDGPDGEGPEQEGPEQEGPESGGGGHDDEQPKIEDNPDDGGGGDDDGNGNNQQTKIKVGDKVRDRNTGGVGIVTAINDDGTYHVEPVTSYAEGGEIANMDYVAISKMDKNGKPIYVISQKDNQNCMSCDILCFGKNGWQMVNDVNYPKYEYNKNFESKQGCLQKLYFVQKERNGLSYTDNIDVAKKYNNYNHIDYFDINCFSICDDLDNLPNENFVIRNYNDGFDTFDNYVVIN